ncbi:hypothetical protein PAMP_010995 [Pampus punctatissimus]
MWHLQLRKAQNGVPAGNTSVGRKKADGGGENASGSIGPTSDLHPQLCAPSPRVISTKFTAATLEY